MLSSARSFFVERKIAEVDCPLITRYASIDAHIDLIPVGSREEDRRYLITSPEYGMKRLISMGMGDIYQLCHVFREGEYGSKHNPEFTMAEWYRIGFTFEKMYHETLDFIRLFLGDLDSEVLSYREAFLRHTGIDYMKSSKEALLNYIFEHGMPTYDAIEKEEVDELLNLILGYKIEPCLGIGKLCCLVHYPASQSALAKTKYIDNEHVAERFEIYFNGIELANGYHELVDEEEQRKRFELSNMKRIQLGKSALPVDIFFLKALQNGLSDCCGVAVGFDRLMMLRHQVKHLYEVIPFDWKTA